jgi:D-aminopeptidase
MRETEIMSGIIRARDLGLDFPGAPGPLNAITDVPGVLVGATTRIEGDGPLVPGQGPVRTGVTAILPLGRTVEPQPVWAGIHALNGNGEMTGSHWVRDGGYLVGPICITNTHSVGMVHHAAVRWMIRTYGRSWAAEHLWAMPVVAETYDGVLNDINGLHVTEADALAALDGAASGPVTEGNTGGGTGMICYEFKGGTGTASRRVSIDDQTLTIGALVQANHGTRPWFTPLGVPAGRHLTEDRLFIGPGESERGSIIVILGTDAPLMPHQLQRVARRAAIGIGRGGTPGGNNSGDIFLAFSVANRRGLPEVTPARLSFDYLNDEVFDALYLGAVEAVEEAVLNALVAARDMTTLKPPGRVCRALNHDRLVEVMRRYGRCR